MANRFDSGHETFLMLRNGSQSIHPVTGEPCLRETYTTLDGQIALPLRAGTEPETLANITNITLHELHRLIGATSVRETVAVAITDEFVQRAWGHNALKLSQMASIGGSHSNRWDELHHQFIGTAQMLLIRSDTAGLIPTLRALLGPWWGRSGTLRGNMLNHEAGPDITYYLPTHAPDDTDEALWQWGAGNAS